VEHVILLDAAGNSIGAADKATVHHADTPLHLAFSCYLFDSTSSRLLLSQRAFAKKTWPGVWTNSCCGHPAPGEDLADAVGRRLRDELGVTATGLSLVLPRFRYRAVMADGVVENEMCPVFLAHTDDEPNPDPAEVAATRWTPWDDLVGRVGLTDLEPISPWCRLQVDELAELGARPRDWPAADHRDLPPAARGAA